MQRRAILGCGGCVVTLTMTAFLYASSQVGTMAAVTRPSNEGGTRKEECKDAPGVQAIPVKSLYRGNLPSVTAELTEAGLLIHGEAEVVDTEANANYVWMVRILSTKGYKPGEYSEPDFERIYTNQMFQVVPDQTTKPKFDDLISPAPLLGAGKFFVELNLVRMAPGMTPDRFRDHEHLWIHAVAGGCSPFSVK